MAPTDDAFFREADSQIRTLTDGLIALERGDEETSVAELFRVAHSLKGSCRTQGLPEAGELAHAVEDVLDAIRAGEVRPTPELVDETLETLDQLAATVEAASVGEQPEGDTDATLISLRDRLDAERARTPADAPDGLALDGPADSDENWESDDLSDDVVAALEETTEFDDIDGLLDQMDDEEGDDLDGWGLLDDEDAVDDPESPDASASPEPESAASAGASTDAAETPENPSAFFEETKAQIDDGDGIDDLQSDIDEVEFGEFDDEDTLTIEELMELEPEDDDPDAEKTGESDAEPNVGGRVESEAEPDVEDGVESEAEPDVGGGVEADADPDEQVADSRTDSLTPAVDPLAPEGASESADAERASGSADTEETTAEAGDATTADATDSTTADGDSTTESAVESADSSESTSEDSVDPDEDVTTFVFGDDESESDEQEVGDSPETDATEPAEAEADPAEAAEPEFDPLAGLDSTPDSESESDATSPEPAEADAASGPVEADAESESVETNTEPAEGGAEPVTATGDADPVTATGDDEPAEADPESQPAGASADAPAAEAAEGSGTELDAGPERDADPEPDVDPEPDADSTPDDGSVPDADSVLDADSVPDADPGPEADSAPDEETAPDSTSVPDADSVPDVDLGVELTDGVDDDLSADFEDDFADDFGEDFGTEFEESLGDDLGGGTETETGDDFGTDLDSDLGDLDADVGGLDADAAGESDMAVSVDEEMAAFESRFDDLLGGGSGGDDEGDEGAVFRSAVGTIEESRLDADEFSTGGVERDPATAREFDRLQSMTVDVDTADRLLNVAEELSLSHLRLDEAVGPETDEAVREEVANLLGVVTEYRQTVMDVRLMALETALDTIPRTVRDVARSQDKEVELVVDDTDVELDRSIVDRLRDPLVHLARNAVDHGIEPPEERESAGKPREGTVEIRGERVGDEVVVELSDDGRGIDPETIRRRAVAQGVCSQAEAERLTDDETFDLLFESGFTTSDEVTDVSGRGVGMDAVERTVADLNGSVTIESDPGEGTTVRLRVPVSIALTEVLFVEVGDWTFGLPMRAVEQITPTPPIETEEGRDVVRRSDLDLVGNLPEGVEAEDSYSLVRLRAALDLSVGGEPDADRPTVDADEATTDADGATADENSQIVWVRSEGERLAVRCDRVVASQEVVVRPYGDLLRDVPGVSGATTLGDGEAVNVLDVSTIPKDVTT